MNRLATNLRALIDRQGISENELADRTGIPQPTINRILRGKSNDPRDATVAPLAEYFGVSVETMKRGAGVDSGAEAAGQVGQPSGRASDGGMVVPHVTGFDHEPGPAAMTFPEILIRELAHLHRLGRIGWVVNPTDSMGDVVPKGVVVFLDRSYQVVRGNGIYAVRLFGEPDIMRVQVRGQGALRVMGSNRFEDAIDLHGEQLNSLVIGGLVVGYADRIKLIE